MSSVAQPAPMRDAPLGPAGRLLATLVNVTQSESADGAASHADELFRQFDRHEDFLERAWPGSHPSADAANARNMAVTLREKALRSQIRITAASGWAGILVKLSHAAVAAGVAWYLLR